jgi:hypothetical protein
MGGEGAQRPVFRVNEPKKTIARSARGGAKCVQNQLQEETFLLEGFRLDKLLNWKKEVEKELKFYNFWKRFY